MRALQRLTAPAAVPSESGEVFNTVGDGTLIVRVVESPEIDTKLTFYAIIISAIAVVLSAVSLPVSAKSQIRHNHDEVRPVVAIHLALINMSVKIKNHGVGPALFEKMVWEISTCGHYVHKLKNIDNFICRC